MSGAITFGLRSFWSAPVLLALWLERQLRVRIIPSAAGHGRGFQSKAAEGQPHSKTLARVAMTFGLRSFWSAPVLLALWLERQLRVRIIPSAAGHGRGFQSKAAEGQPHSKTLARVAMTFGLRSFWSAPVLLALWLERQLRVRIIPSAAGHGRGFQSKAAEGQPHSKTLARVAMTFGLRSFWSAPVLLALWLERQLRVRIIPSAAGHGRGFQSKAAEGQPHSKTLARVAMTFGLRSFWSAPVLLALWLERQLRVRIIPSAADHGRGFQSKAAEGQPHSKTLARVAMTFGLRSFWSAPVLLALCLRMPINAR